MFSVDFSKLGEFICILMDPPWKLKNTPHQPGFITPQQLGKLKIDEKLLPAGFIFCWVDKEIIPEAVKVMKKWGFIYVENFVWVRKHVNNRIATDPSAYFCRSKQSVLIFRRDGPHSVELRHQRSPDVDFHFSLKHPSDSREDKNPVIYDLIETLLPTAHYDPVQKRGKFLELWAKKGHTKKRLDNDSFTPLLFGRQIINPHTSL